MNLHQLKILLAIAKHRSFTKAAQELHLSQPALSLHVKELEEEYGVDLFDRLGRSVTLTEAGKVVEDGAVRLFALIREMEEALAELKGLRHGHLLLGASTTPGVYLLPRVLSEFQRRYPGIELSVEVANTGKIERSILRDELDVGVVGGSLVAEEQLMVEPYLEDELVIIVPSGHPFAKKGKVNPKELKGQRFLVREEGSATRRVAEEALRQKGIEVELGMELGNTEAIKRAVAEGMGVAIVSIHAAEQELKTGRLRAVRIINLPIHRLLKIVYRRRKRLSLAAKAFLQLLREITV